jgi:hypothetical protein
VINVAVANGADPQVLATAFSGALDSYIRSSEFPSDLARSGESSLFNGTTIGIIVAPNTTVSAPSGVRPKHHRRAHYCFMLTVMLPVVGWRMSDIQGVNPCGTVCPCGRYQRGRLCRDRLSPLQVRIINPRARPNTTVQVQVSRRFQLPFIVITSLQVNPCTITTINTPAR